MQTRHVMLEEGSAAQCVRSHLLLCLLSLRTVATVIFNHELGLVGSKYVLNLGFFLGMTAFSGSNSSRTGHVLVSRQVTSHSHTLKNTTTSASTALK